VSAVLLVSVFLIAACGLIYELIAGSLASYLLGDSILQFSTIIGSYLAAMGLGSFLSSYITRGLVARFVEIELMVGLVGGFSSSLLFLAFAYTSSFRLLLYVLVVVIGTLVGLEIPLLMRILKERFQFKELVAHVLTFDYLGSLGASLLFPILLVPKLGMVRSALLFGLINAGVALWSVFLFRDQIARQRSLIVQCGIVIAMLLTGAVFAEQISNTADNQLYADDVIFTRDTQYQRIVLTKWKDDLRLFLHSHLQFSSRDEYRYHEALVHPGLSSLPGARRVLVLGGGDGLAVREILRYPDVERIQLTDLDPEMTKLFSTHPLLSELNQHSLTNPKLHITNADAFVWLDQTQDMYDFVVVDFPDPTNYSLGKLYTTAFYRLLKRHVSRGGLVVVQSTSPLFARQSYWCIAETMKQAGFQVNPYHVYVPSFGEWGFILGGLEPYEQPTSVPGGLRFLTARDLPQMFQFPLDMQPVTVIPNRLNDQVLVRYYDAEWRTIAR
jgi:spermidine synthase